MRVGLLLLAVLALCSVAVARQPVPFDPIHPGSLHADHFSPLNGNTVTVDRFLVGEFTAFLLDFSSLTSATPVTIDIAGGVNFNNINFEASGAGPVSVLSQVNSLNLEAFRGEVRFDGFTTNATATGGDISVSSFNGDIFIDSTFDSVNFAAAGISVIGQFANQSVNLNSQGNTEFYTGGRDIAGNIDIHGETILLSGDFLNVISTGSQQFLALDKLYFDAEGAVQISSNNQVQFLANAGPLSFDANFIDIQSPVFDFTALGANSISSVLGSVLIDSGFTEVLSADSVNIVSSQDGIHLQADNNVVFSAGSAIRFSGEPITNFATIEAQDLQLSSVKDRVSIYALDYFDFLVDNDVTFTSGNDQIFNAQETFTVNTTTTALFNTGILTRVSAGELLAIRANTEALFTAKNDLLILTGDLASVEAPRVDFTITDTSLVSVDANVLEISAASQIYLRSGQNAFFIGIDGISLTSGAGLTYNGRNINVNSEDSVYVQSGESLSVTTNGGDVTVTSPNSGAYLAQQNTFTGDITTADYLVRALETLTVAANQTGVFTSIGKATVRSVNDFTIAESLVEFTTGQEITFTTGNAAEWNVEEALSFTTTSAENIQFSSSNDDLQIETGDFFSSGKDLLVDAGDSFFITVRNGTFNAPTGVITTEATTEFGFAATGTLNVTSDGKTTFDAVNMVIQSRDFNEGDLLFKTLNDDLNIQADTIVVLGNRFETNAGDDTVFTVDSFQIIQSPVGTNPTSDYGNVQFLSGKDFVENVQNSVEHTQRTGEYSGDENVFISGGSLSVTTTADAAFQSNSDVTITGDALTFTSNNITFAGVEGVTIDAGDTLTGNAGNAININVNNGSSVTSSGTTTVTTVGKGIVQASGDLIVSGGSVTISAADALRLQTSGGGNFSSLTSTGFTFTDSLQAQAEEFLSLVSTTGLIQINSAQSLSLLGGDIEFSSTVDTTLTFSNTLLARARDGNALFGSGSSLISNAEDLFSLSGYSPVRPFLGGRYGMVEAYQGDVCFTADYSAKDSVTSFTGSSTLVSAAGNDSTLNWDANQNLLFAAGYTTGLSAYGWSFDPEFILDDDEDQYQQEDDTFGILFRADTGDFTIDSASGVNAFANLNLTLFSDFGTGSFSAAKQLDFRTYSEGANIYFTAANGNIEINSAQKASVYAGNPEHPADISINATRDIIFDTTSSLIWNNLGTSTVKQTLGVLIQAYDAMNFTAVEEFIVASNDGGNVFFGTRDGDATFTSTNGNLNFRALEGSILMTGRGATFTTTTGELQIDAQGEGGSVYLRSGADETFSVDATESSLFFEALQGEIDLNAFNGLTAAVATDFTLEGSCVTVKGGSVLVDAQTIALNSDQNIAFTADVGFTVDSSTIALNGNQVIVNAGGDGVQAGLSANSVGGIGFTSAADLTWVGVNFASTSADETTVTAVNSISVLSELDSTAQDNILIQAQSTNVNFLGVEIEKHATRVLQTTSDNIVSTSLNNTQLEGTREVRFVFESDFTQTATEGSFNNLAGNLDASIQGEGEITATTGALSFNADAALTFSAGETTLDTVSLDVIAQALNSAILLNAVSYTATVNGDFVTNSGGLLSVEASGQTTGISLTASAFTDILSGGDINFNSVDSYSLTTDTLTTNSSNHLVETLGFFYAINQQTVDFTATNFLATAFSNILIEGTNTILIETAQDQNVTFTSRSGDITINPTESISFTDRNTEFISVASNIFPGEERGISILANTYTSSALSTFYIGTEGVSFTATESIDFTSAFQTNLFSTGPEGVQIVAPTLTANAGADILFQATNGNVFLGAETTVGTYTGTGTATFDTSAEFGNIQFEFADGGVVETFNANAIVVQSTGDPTRPMNGFIKSEASSIVVNAPTLTLIADDDVELLANENAFITATTLTYAAEFVAEFLATTNLFVTSPVITINSGATVYSSVDYNPIVFNTDQFSLINYATIEADVSGFARIDSQTSTFFNANDISLTSIRTGSFEATSGDVYIGADPAGALGSNTFTTQNILASADGNDGTSQISGTTAQSTGEILMDAGQSIFAPFQTITTNTLVVDSASSVEFDANSISFSSDNLLVSANADGNVLIRADDTIRFQGDFVRFVSTGDLGSQGGRYVLSDEYWLAYDNEIGNRNRRTNINTNGFESTAVQGSLNLVANTGRLFFAAGQGSIEFRAQRAIRWSAPSNTGRVYFYGKTDDYDTNDGVHSAVTFGLSNNYCGTSALGPNACSHVAFTCTVNCSNISAIINQIIRGLVAYGLLECSDPALGCAYTGGQPL